MSDIICTRLTAEGLCGSCQTFAPLSDINRYVKYSRDCLHLQDRASVDKLESESTGGPMAENRINVLAPALQTVTMCT